MSNRKKKYLRNLFIMLCFFGFVSGCGLIQINGSFRGLTSYYDKSMIDCGRLFCAMGTGLDARPRECKVLIATGKDVKRGIVPQEKTIIYLWAPNCKGKFCPSPILLQQKCQAEGVKLLVVAEYYDCKMMSHFAADSFPLIGIDVYHYKSNYTNEYVQLFLSDLTDSSGIKSEGGRFFYFEGGRFIHRTDSL